MSEMIELAGLWKQKSKKTGREYLVGTLRKGVRIYVLQNEKKKSKNEPDFRILIAAAEPKENRNNARA